MKELSRFEVCDFFREKTGNYSKEPPSYIWNKVESVVFSKFGLKMLKQQLLRNWGKISVIFGTGVIVGGLAIYITGPHQPDSITDQISLNSSSEIIEYDKSNNEIIETQIDILEQKDLKLTSEANTEIIQHKGDIIINPETISSPELNKKEKKHSKEIITESDENKLLVENNESYSEEISPDEDSKSIPEKEHNLKKSKEKRDFYLNISKIRKIKKLTIVDDSGNQLLIMKSPQSSFNYLPINISDIPSGKYFINILTEKQSQGIVNNVKFLHLLANIDLFHKNKPKPFEKVKLRDFDYKITEAGKAEYVFYINFRQNEKGLRRIAKTSNGKRRI